MYLLSRVLNFNLIYSFLLTYILYYIEKIVKCFFFLTIIYIYIYVYIKTFNAIENKSQCFFIQLDIVEFYPSIPENILDTAVNFVKQYTDISDENLRIIKHCRKSLLYNNHEPWKKKDTDSCFDVTMGSYDGAEVFEQVGTYVLSLLANIIDKNDSGLYRDDGLIFLRNVDGQKMDRVRKNVIKIFKEVGFKIKIQTHLKIVNFLDVTFNLANGTYRP